MHQQPKSRGLAALAILVLLAVSAPPTVAQDRPESVLRVLSWNSFNLPTIAGEMGNVNMDEEKRGRLVARILKESGYDVIALNEVFDETVRDALIEEAESGPGRFRFVVEDLDGGGSEDSGLMLLSRLDPVRFTAPEPDGFQHQTSSMPSGPIIEGTAQPFTGTDAEYLDTRNCADMDVWTKTDGETPSWIPGSGGNCLVAFHRFRSCTHEPPETVDDVPEAVLDPFFPLGAECDAGKGVAYVRLKQRNGRFLDVFWSHTQATLRTPEYEAPLPDFLGARDGQMAEIAAMVRRWSDPGSRDAAILGDLNIDGLQKDGGFIEEYRKQLAGNADSRFGALGFRDLWPLSSTKEDPGPTYSARNDHNPPKTPDERLDYILWRDLKGRDTCDQQPRIERHFDHVTTGHATIDLSDHFGVGAALRLRSAATDLQAEPCSPSLAKPLAELLPTGVMQGTLAVPGACQWMRIDQGTWTVTNLSAPTLVMRAFLVRDVSEPLAFFRGDEVLQSVRKTRDEVQVALEEPFLVQMCWQEPTRTGLYRVRVSPNVGADPEHPVVLPLNRPVPLSFGNQFGANPTTKLWTVAVVPKTFSGDGHKLRLDLGDHASTKLRAGTAPVGGPAPVITWLNSLTSSEGILDAGAHGGAAKTEIHAVIEREPPASPGATVAFSARVLTDHHEVTLGVLECIEQEDSTGDDTVRMTYAADGKKLEIVKLGDFDEGQDTNLSTRAKLGRNWVRGDVKITLFDQDGEDLENDVTSGNALDNLGTVTIPKFSSDPPETEEKLEDSGKFTQDEANSRLEYVRRR